MKTKITLLISVLSGMLVAFYINYGSLTVKSGLNQPQPSIPRKLIIPALGLNTLIEAVGKDADGRMSVPQKIGNSGWYSPGVRPGEAGNAVINGHMNTPKLQPAIFADLNKLRTGDIIIIEDDAGQNWYFTVKSNHILSTDNFPTKLVFGSANTSHLNLITCDGVYQRKRKDYSHRTVIFSDLSGTGNKMLTSLRH